MKKTEKSFKVGIVDDHVQTAVSISQMLKYNGYKTFQSYSGKDAVKDAKKEKPDLMLVDVRMDGFSGYDVAKALSKVKMFFMTGYDIEEIEIKKYKNVLEVLKKPIDMNDLLGRLKKYFKI